MQHRAMKIGIGCLVAAGMSSAAVAQGAAAGAPKGSVVVTSPTYTSIPMEITVNRPAAELWARIGKYCDVAEWLQVPQGCRIVSGKDGEVGAVRSVGGGEVLVARTEFSYTYAQDPCQRALATHSTSSWQGTQRRAVGRASRRAGLMGSPHLSHAP